MRKLLFASMKLFACLVCLCRLVFASASAVYVTQNGAGTADGTSLASAFALPALSSSGNCGSGSAQIGPGTTVHLNGTFTLSNGTVGFMLPAACGGSAGNPVLIQFDPGAIWQAGYFPGAGSIIAPGLSYLTMDGTGAMVQNTTNGSPTATCLSGAACSTQQASVFIQALNCTSCEFRNFTVQDLYIHTSCEAASGCDTALEGASDVNAIYYGGTVLVHDNVIHDVGWAFYGNTGTVPAQSFYGNEVYNMDHGIMAGANASGAVIGDIYIYNNHFHDMAAWDTGVADAYHHDYIHAWSAAGGKIQNIHIFNNLFDGNEGNCCVTAMVYLEGSTGPPWGDSTSTAYIYNNVFIGSLELPASQVYVASGAAHVFANNTMIVPLANTGGCLGFYQSSTNVTIENNVIEGCNVLLNAGTATSFAAIDYNFYGNAVGGNPFFNFAAENSTTLAGWQSVCSCDAHSIGVSPLSATIPGLTSSGEPQALFAGDRAGANLTALGITSLDSDKAAVPRPSSGPWDIGAYQYVPAAPASNLLAVRR
jgi:hypothetical protein